MGDYLHNVYHVHMLPRHPYFYVLLAFLHPSIIMIMSSNCFRHSKTYMQTWWTIVTTHAILDQEQKFAALWLANIHYRDPSRYNWLCAMCTSSMFMLSEKSDNGFSSEIVTIAKQCEMVLKQRLAFRWNSNDTLIAGRADGAAAVATKHIRISVILKA